MAADRLDIDIARAWPQVVTLAEIVRGPARRKLEAPSQLADEPLLAPRPAPKVEPKVEAKAPDPRPAEVKAPEARPVAVPPAEAPAEESAPERTEEEAQAGAARSDSLVRLRKRSRAVVVLSRTAAFDDILRSFLQEDGYGRVLSTIFPDEIFDLLRQPNLGVLFLDGNMSIVDALEFVQNLRAASHKLPPVVLAAEDVSTAIVLAARRNGVAQLVIRPYALDAAFSALLAEQIALN